MYKVPDSRSVHMGEGMGRALIRHHWVSLYQAGHSLASITRKLASPRAALQDLLDGRCDGNVSLRCQSTCPVCANARVRSSG